jgi:signal transduction histidine kinase
MLPDSPKLDNGTMMTTPERNQRGADLPPPPPTPPGARMPDAAAPERPSTSTRSVSGRHGDEWSWDRAKDLAEQWYTPLSKPDGWYALAHLFASALAAPILFGAMVGFAAVTFGLMFALLLGLFLIVPLFSTVDAFTRLSVWFATFAGHTIELRQPTPVAQVGLRSAKTVLTDNVRWRQVGFLAANTLLAPVFFAIGFVPVSISWQAIIGEGVGGPFSFGLGPIVGLVVAAFMVGLIPRVAVPVSNVKARVDAWFVGTDQLALAQARVSALSGQRDDILDAVASERRRIERNLHDGVQQQLVAIGLDLGMAESHLDANPDRARELIVSAREKVQGSIGELRQLGRGLHPAILDDRGIDAALSAIVGGSSFPISVHVDANLELSRDIEETIYFMANEAIANILKHANATVASVHVMKMGKMVRVIINDNGIGGATVGTGTGIAGMRARVHAVDGTFSFTSPTGGPTTLNAEIPAR